MVKAIERRLVNGEWVTGVVDENGGNGGSQPDLVRLRSFTVTAAQAAAVWSGGAGIVPLFTPDEGTIILRTAVLILAEFHNAALAYIALDAPAGNGGWDLSSNVVNTANGYSNPAGSTISGWNDGSIFAPSLPEAGFPLIVGAGAGPYGLNVQEATIAGDAPTSGSCLVLVETALPA